MDVRFVRPNMMMADDALKGPVGVVGIEVSPIIIYDLHNVRHALLAG